MFPAAARWFFAIVSLFAFVAPGAADSGSSIAFRRLQIPDDVPASMCTALAQDPLGFLWIGTQGGLVRFDGSSFRTFRADAANPSTLSGSYVRSLLAARDGTVWVGTFSGGLSRLDPNHETFTRYVHDARDARSLANDRVEGLAEDDAGRIWIGTNEGLDRLDPRTGRLEHFRHVPADSTSLAHDTVRGLLADREGRIWVGTRDGLQRWRGEGKGFERIASTAGVAGSLSGELVVKLHEDPAGRVWIGTAEHGAAVFDPRAGTLRRIRPRPEAPDGLSHFWVYGFADGPGDELWVATFGGGVDVIDTKTLAITSRLVNDPTLDDTINANRVGAILRDRAGVIWVGSWGEGIARHDPSTRPFRTLRYSPSRPDGLTHASVVRTLERSDGTIWAGTNGNGIDILDGNLRRVDAFRPDPADPKALSDGAITCLTEAPDGSMWVATLNGVLQHLPRGARRFERFGAADGLPNGPVRAIAVASDGSIWAGAAYGLAHLDPATRKATTWKHDPSDPHSLSGTAVESVVIAPNGHLWVGTDDGLDDFDPARGTFSAIHHDHRVPDSLPDDWVPDLMFAHDGRLWVGTHGGAAILKSWDGTSAHFDIVALRIHRPTAPAEELIEDAGGDVWIGPRLRVDPRSWKAREFGPADGCTFRNFFIASRARTGDGRLLFGSPAGLLIVDPHSIAEPRFEPNIVATDLHVAGREIAGAPRTARLVLQPAGRSFALDVAALDPSAGNQAQFRYRLEGSDHDWSVADAAHRTIAYARLPPGSYLLRVGATTRNGAWSSRELRLPVVVVPALWETTPFRIFAAAVAALLAWAVYRLRVRQLEARSAALEKTVAQRTSELADKNRELEHAYATIREASLTDPLTRLRNRRYLEQAIGPDLALALRGRDITAGDGEARDLLFFLLDLDHFKSVNDTHGHPAGDAVLVQIADVLRSTFRTSDHLVRWGGEEFLVVARFVDRSNAEALAEKVRCAIEQHPFALPDATVIRRTVSIGFTAWPSSPAFPDAVPWEQAVAVADAALYVAKREGRNRWIGIDVSRSMRPLAAIESFLTDPAAADEVIVRSAAAV